MLPEDSHVWMFDPQVVELCWEGTECLGDRAWLTEVVQAFGV